MTQSYRIPFTRLEHGLHEIAARYDGFLIDQWGVLHDGTHPYPGAAEALRQLRGRAACVLVLSNSGKRAAANAERMARLGFAPDSYDALLTSGEVAWQALSEPRDPAYWHFGQRCLLIAQRGDDAAVAGLQIEVVGDPERADFVLLSSLDDDVTITHYTTLLNRALSRGLPLLCTNPDRIRLARRGTAPGAGALAYEYERSGGQVLWLGKPHPEMYDYARRAFTRAGARRILCIGDSLQHDVRGGQEAGFDTLFITEGILAERFRDLDRAAADQQLQTLCSEYDAWPDWVLPQLRW